jgi:rfaE bifunctional protein kinase chain/domain
LSHLLVIGDIILDHYITGHSYRLSQEAPVPVVAVEEDRFVLGGAANVAANIRSLGGTATLIGVIGTDPQGDMVLKECSDAGVNSESIIRLNTRPTTEKCRVQSGHYQIVRYDRESVEVVSKDTITLIIETINNLAGLYDGVVIADYAKGLIP